MKKCHSPEVGEQGMVGIEGTQGSLPCLVGPQGLSARNCSHVGMYVQPGQIF